MYRRVSLNRTIKARRLALGLDPSHTAERVGLSVHEYDDLEAYADEAYEAVSLRTLARLCAVLRIDTAQLCDLDGQPADIAISRVVDIRAARQASGLSMSELASAANIETAFLQTIEADAQVLLDRSVLGVIVDIANIVALDLGGFCAKYLRAT